MVSTSHLSTSTTSLSSLGYMSSLSDSPTPGEELKLRKLFVGGLPWSTTTETLKKHFEQFGEIEEAAVIFDKETGKSKGFGFVTMKERKCADEACKDPNPYIDGRKANVNLAFLGQKPRTSSFSGSNPNLAALGLRPGAITPTSPGGAGLLGPHGHVGMHGAGLGAPGNYLYSGGSISSMTAAALMLQQNLALAALQQQQQHQQQLALATAAAMAQQQQAQTHPQMHSASAHSVQPSVSQHHTHAMSPQQLFELQAIYAANTHPVSAHSAAVFNHPSITSFSQNSDHPHLMIPGTQAGVPINPAAAAQLALLSQLTNASSNTGNQSP